MCTPGSVMYSTSFLGQTCPLCNVALPLDKFQLLLFQLRMSNCTISTGPSFGYATCRCLAVLCSFIQTVSQMTTYMCKTTAKRRGIVLTLSSAMSTKILKHTYKNTDNNNAVKANMLGLISLFETSDFVLGSKIN